jgi:hypothetical protein
MQVVSETANFKELKTDAAALIEFIDNNASEVNKFSTPSGGEDFKKFYFGSV